LRDTAVDDRVANVSFRAVVGRLNRRIAQEAEAVLGRWTFESLGQLLGQRMAGRTTYPAHEALLDGEHLSHESLLAVTIAPGASVAKSFFSHVSNC